MRAVNVNKDDKGEKGKKNKATASATAVEAQ